MRVTISVPGHITGFFSVYEHEDVLLTGSRGCGVVVDKGVITRVEVERSNENSLETFIDGKGFACPVSASVVSDILSIVDGNYAVKIEHDLKVPMAQGFGTSAAGAIGVAMGMNAALSLDMSEEELGKISHKAEVENMTGMGDVSAIMEGGVVVRKKEGAPGIGKTVALPWKGGLFSFILGSSIETRRVLEDAAKKERITRIGEACLKEFLEEPSEESFIKLSRRFAYDTMLATEDVRGAIERLEKAGVEAAMVMLGNSIFGFSDSPEEVTKILDKECIELNVDASGPRIIGKEEGI